MTVGIYEFCGNCFPCNKKSFSFPYLLTHIISTLPVSRTIGIHLQLRNGLHQIVKTALFVQYGYFLHTTLVHLWYTLEPLTHGYNRDAPLLISDFPHLQRHISIFRLRYKRESRCISNSWWIELSCISVEQYFFTMHLYWYTDSHHKYSCFPHLPTCFNWTNWTNLDPDWILASLV